MYFYLAVCIAVAPACVIAIGLLRERSHRRRRERGGGPGADAHQHLHDVPPRASTPPGMPAGSAPDGVALTHVRALDWLADASAVPGGEPSPEPGGGSFGGEGATGTWDDDSKHAALEPAPASAVEESDTSSDSHSSDSDASSGDSDSSSGDSDSSSSSD